MNVLDAREGYRLWAPSYESETAVSHLENVVVTNLALATAGTRLLDVGCGTARRLRDADAAHGVGVDVTFAMLAHARTLAGANTGATIAAADAGALPFASGSFDVVWCRLMIGHVRDCDGVVAELARVCRAGGVVVVSDVCADAIAAGHRRTFRGPDGETRELEHFVHTAERMDRVAREQGLQLDVRATGVVGPEIRSFYAAANRLALYDAQLGEPLVVVASYRKCRDLQTGPSLRSGRQVGSGRQSGPSLRSGRQEDRVVHVSFHADAQRRDAASLLRAWPTLSRVAIAAKRGGADVVVVQRAHRDELVELDGVNFHFVDDRDPHCARVIERVVTLLPDVVHVQGLNEPWPTRRLARAVSGVPMLAQDHGSVSPTGLRALAWRWAFHSLAGVAFTARAQAEPWMGSGVLRRGIPVFEVLEGSSAFTPGNRDEARRLTGMSGDPCLLWTGRLDANKDPLMMLAAVERAAAMCPGLRLYCCFGDAPLEHDVQARVSQSEVLAMRVTMLGTRPHAELEQRYRAADFYLQTSHREGSGYSLLEALACGATPLVTDIPAARAIVGDVGSLTAVGDAIALGDAIVAMASRERQSLRVAARARFDEALTFDAIGRRLCGVYAALASAVAR